MLMLQVFASSHKGASIFSYAAVMPLMMIGGSMFPFELMPGWMASIGRLTPNGWSLENLKAILLGRATAMPIGAAFALLMAISVALFLVAGIRTVRVFARR